MASVTIELNRQFDPGRWQIAGRRDEGGPTLLMTWELETDPVDAGMPREVQTVLAEALCSLGFCCFAGDPGSGTSIGPLTLRRGLSRRRTEILRAERAADLLPAFDSGAHDWSMAAQWIVVSAPGTARDTVLALLKGLLDQWELPAEWPAVVPVIVQAGVDGDAAGCHCRTPEAAQKLADAIQRSATAHAVAVRLVA